jgi:BTB/POZ domain
MHSADVILQSSDLVQFRVHRSVLVTASPFFADMFSLPQPQNDAAPNELPVVYLSEDAEVLNSLISVLYPVPPEMPLSSDNILSLLSAAAKYDMDEAQSSIRAQVSHRGLLSSTRAEIFRVYAVAYRKGLISELATAARLTLGHPLTFESLGDALRLFDGGALRDLANFRIRSRQNFCSNWGFLSTSGGTSKIWVGCPMAKGGHPTYQPLPTWLQNCLQLPITMVDFGIEHYERFTETIPTPEQLYDKYLKALQKHVKEDDCQFCMKVHILEGENFVTKMKNISTQAWNVPPPM